MVVISYAFIRDYVETNPGIGDASGDWYHKTKAADWKNFAELRQTFNSADYVGNERFVFDIRDNRYRLVAGVVFLFAQFLSSLSALIKLNDAINAATIDLKKK